MESSTIALLTMLAALILFIIPQIPMLFTCIAISCFLYFSGLATASEALSGFNAVATWAVIGMGMMSAAFFSTGLANIVGTKLFRLTRGNQKRATVVLMLVGAIMCTFINAMAVIIILTPMMDAMVASSNGKLSRRMCWMPMAVGCLMGCVVDLMGASNVLTASALFEEVSGRGFHFFELAPIAIPAVIVTAIYYGVIGTTINEKVFQFEELPVAASEGENQENSLKMSGKAKITIVVFVVTVIVMSSGKWSIGIVSFAAAAILIITGCCTTKEALNAVPWNVVVIMGCIIGFAGVINSSGAGLIIGNTILNISNHFGFGTFGLCVLVGIMGQIVSNFMSNNAAIVIAAPIAISVAQAAGLDPLGLLLIACFNVNTSILTPLAAPLLSVGLQVGYRFSDYIRANALLTLLVFFTTVCLTNFIYY